MKKKLYLYGAIYDFLIAEFNKSIQDVSGESIEVHINTDGGNPEAGWGAIVAISEFEGDKNVVVDGKAYSMGALSLPYFDKSSCYDFSQFLIHRAAYSEWYEDSPYFTDALKTNLENINSKLKEALIAKIDVAKFEKIAGHTIDEVFSMDSRIDVFLTAKQAKQIGLVDEVLQLTPQKSAEVAADINSRVQMMTVKSAASFQVSTPTVEIPKVVKPINKNNMTKEDFQREHPEAYNAIVAIGVNQERDRVNSWAVFASVDPDKVFEGIKSGNPVTLTDNSEFQLKAINSGTLNVVKQAGAANGGAGAPTEDLPKPGEEKELTEAEKMQAEIDAKLGKAKK